MKRRARIARSVEKDVLVASRRRCCLCVFVNRYDEIRKGQIAHLNRNPSDSRFANLVFLCLDHHDDFDSRTSQSKNFTAAEVRQYRDRLYVRLGTDVAAAADQADSGGLDLEPLPDVSVYEKLLANSPDLDFIKNRWRYHLWQVANEPEYFAYKAGNRSDGVCLIERIDVPDGRIVMACIETAGNPGNSITNCVEELCFQVCERFDVPPHRLVWLEHYDYYEPQEWSMVTFGQQPPDVPFADPTWTRMTPELWRSLRLKPKAKLKQWYGRYQSKLTKLFEWPTQGLFDYD